MAMESAEPKRDKDPKELQQPAGQDAEPTSEKKQERREMMGKMSPDKFGALSDDVLDQMLSRMKDGRMSSEGSKNWEKVEKAIAGNFLDKVRDKGGIDKETYEKVKAAFISM